jgi:hypothetical protein
MDELKLDGNAAAGILQEIFSVEITAALGTCDGCGAVEAVGAVAVYARGPGTVLRCPHCDNVLVKVVSDGARIWADLRGVRMLELRV